MKINRTLALAFALGTGSVVVDKQFPSTPDSVAWGLALVSVCAFMAWAWDWSGQFRAVTEPHRNRRTKVMRWVVMLLTGGCGVLFYVVLFHLAEPQLSSAETARLERYRQFYLNAEAPNKTTFIEMTNAELKTRTRNVIPKLRKIAESYDAQSRSILQDAALSQEAKTDRVNALMARFGQEYSAYRVETSNCLQELRNRIPFAARKHLAGLPNLRSADPRDGSVSLLDLIPDQIAPMFLQFLDRELETLVALLPD